MKKRILIKFVVLIAIVAIITIAISSFKPIITNEMAMTQMENSNELYAAHQAYNSVAPWLDYAPLIIGGIGVCIIICKEII